MVIVGAVSSGPLQIFVLAEFSQMASPLSHTWKPSKTNIDDLPGGAEFTTGFQSADLRMKGSQIEG